MIAASWSRERLTDLLARASVGILFALFAIQIWKEFLHTGHVTGLLLAVSESLVVVLTVVRRRAQVVDRSRTSRIVTFLALIGPPLLRPTSVPPLLSDSITAVASGLGLIVAISGKLTIRRSFGVLAANRGVVTAGPYAVVRHPIYIGYMVQHLAFVAAHPTVQNIAVFVIADSFLIVRALIEERVLVRDDAYRAYCARVSWHLVPGVF